uniref:Uncharacterized protein n=1 Tax=Branchiostoma floridae TaxID=7739 RepID=C3Z0B3_BRAFL|eukprot:XP_002597949.1 hypothetical protein BRAFLDRAFT_79808 [Branchiostoma floridae]
MTDLSITSLANKFQNLELCLKSQHDQEVSYGRALREAIISGDLLTHIEVLKSLGDLHFQKGKLNRHFAEFDKAFALYFAAMWRTNNYNMRETINHRIKYIIKLSQKLFRGYIPQHNYLLPGYWGTAESNVLRVAEICDKFDQRLAKQDIPSAEDTYTQELVTAITDGDVFLEEEILKSLGDLYLNEGKKTSHKMPFTKAVSMYLEAQLGHKVLNDMGHAARPGAEQTLHHRILYAQKVCKAKGLLPMLFYSSNAGNEVDSAADTFVDDRDPDSQYQDHLRKGNSSLETADLDWAEKHFASALRIAHVRDPTAQQYQREVEPLCKLGDVYSKRGQQTGDGGDFVKAAALYNAAIARSKDETVNDNKAKHIKMLEEMRDQIKLEMETIDQQLDPYVHDEDDPCVKEIEAKLAQAVRKLFENIAQQRKEFISQLVEECIGLMGPAPLVLAMTESHWCIKKMTRRLYGQYTAHPDIASILATIGKTWHALGDYRKAITYLQQALQMCINIYGESRAHSVIAIIHNNLGLVLQELGEYRRAVESHEQALQMYRSVHGQRTAHSEIASVLNNLGLNWYKLGDCKKASGYYNKALEMFRRVYGQNTAHVEIATSLNNIGQVWDVLGDHRKGIKYFEQALDMCLIIVGKTAAHPLIADIHNNLGPAWEHLHSYTNARTHYDNALQMYRSMYGPGKAHPDIAMSLSNLGTIWSDLGDHRKSMSYNEQALHMYRSIHGQATTHHDIATALNNMGSTWVNLGETRKGIDCFEQALEMYRSIYVKSAGHHNIAATLGNLGTAWRDLGDIRKEIGYYEQALQMYRSIYGQNTAHPDIVKYLVNAGGSLGKSLVITRKQ